MSSEPTKAELAVEHTLRAIMNDGRKAYLIGWGSEAFRLLTDAQADRLGEDADAFRERFWSRPERVTTAEDAP